MVRRPDFKPIAKEVDQQEQLTSFTSIISPCLYPNFARCFIRCLLKCSNKFFEGLRDTGNRNPALLATVKNNKKQNSFSPLIHLCSRLLLFLLSLFLELLFTQRSFSHRAYRESFKLLLGNLLREFENNN